MLFTGIFVSQEFSAAKRNYQKAKNPTKTQRKAFKTAKEKFVTASSVMNKKNYIKVKPQHAKWKERNTSSSSQLLASSSSTSQPSSSSHQPLSSAQLSPSTISTVNHSPENQNENIDELKLPIKRLEKELNIKNSTMFALQNQLLSIDKKISYETLFGDEFEYITGLSVQEFDILFECVEPYISCMEYI